MKAETITLTVTIRPSYGRVDHVKQEITDSLDWLIDGHNAISIGWGSTGEGEWPDDPEDDK